MDLSRRAGTIEVPPLRSPDMAAENADADARARRQEVEAAARGAGWVLGDAGGCVYRGASRPVFVGFHCSPREIVRPSLILPTTIRCPEKHVSKKTPEQIRSHLRDRHTHTPTRLECRILVLGHFWLGWARVYQCTVPAPNKPPSAGGSGGRSPPETVGYYFHKNGSDAGRLHYIPPISVPPGMTYLHARSAPPEAAQPVQPCAALCSPVQPCAAL